MTEQQHLITPPPELRRLWAEQARRMYSHDPVAWIEHVTNQAARWGWQQRDASVPEELQKARATAWAAADAADAAEAAARLRQRDLLLRLIAEAPVVEKGNE